MSDTDQAARIQELLALVTALEGEKRGLLAQLDMDGASLERYAAACEDYITRLATAMAETIAVKEQLATAQQDAARWQYLKTHLAAVAIMPQGGSVWEVALPLASTFDEAADLAMAPQAAPVAGEEA